jgi:hypothetical protein
VSHLNGHKQIGKMAKEKVFAYKVDSLTNLNPNSIVALKVAGSKFELYVTDLQGVPYSLNATMDGAITSITNTDGNLTITGTTTKVINISQALIDLINNSVQVGDNITDLLNDAGYITIVDLIASNVGYINGSFTNVQQALDSLLYVIPNISGFSITPSVVEIGTTVSSVTLNWALNKIFTTLSINNGIGVIPPNLLTRTQNVSLTINTTFTITGGDGTSTDSENVSLLFRSKRWWGTNSSDTLTNTNVLTLANGELSTNRQQTRTINGGGQYIWFAFPTSYGLPNFVVNGLPSTAFATTTVSHTNASGNVQNYYVIRTTTVQNGTLTIQIL